MDVYAPQKRVSATRARKAYRADKKLEPVMLDRLLDLTLPANATDDMKATARANLAELPLDRIAEKLVQAERQAAQEIGRAARGKSSAAITRAVEDIVRVAGNHLKHYQQAAALSAGYKIKVGYFSTDIDKEIGRILYAGLTQIFPDDKKKGKKALPVVSRNYAAFNRSAADGRAFWLVNTPDLSTPDAMRAFLQRDRDFTLSVALVKERQPVLGVVYAPLQDRLFTGVPRDGYATVQVNGHRRKIHTHLPQARARNMLVLPKPDARAVSAFKRDHHVRYTHRGGDIALNFCRIAQGTKPGTDAGYDFYPQLTAVQEWEVAAAHAIMLAAGGTLVGMDNEPVTYANRDRKFLLPPVVGAAKFALLKT